ncbi:MAG: hypothetical protein BEN18_07740 [Epulopiscium sp. Nuni2H_MBin001]|nr:MAG: hypothetical protein BEN18_07740 [Epulopiscium sp. Nuni2H_MBin001]
MTRTKLSTKDIAYIGLVTTLIVICSWISIPMAIPFTLQTFAVAFALLFLGGKKGTLAIMIYLLIGAIGIPVFANFRGGIASLVSPTGGYLVGFLIQGFIYSLFIPRFGESNMVKLITLLIGNVAIYAFGTIWFLIVIGNTMTFWVALGMCVFPYVIPDMIKLALAFVVVNRLKPILRKSTTPT